MADSSSSRPNTLVSHSDSPISMLTSSAAPYRDARPPISIGSGLAANDKGRLIKPINKQSEHWKHFHSYSNDSFTANCNFCKKDVGLGKSFSTSQLRQQLASHHRSEMVGHLVLMRMQLKPPASLIS
jgi:hypothetical protein